MHKRLCGKGTQMPNKYPILIRRYLAAVLDISIALSCAILLVKLLVLSGVDRDDLYFLVFYLPFLLYEPLLTSKAATVGQLIFRFRVRKIDEKTKIDISHAYARLLIKLLLGWISLLTVPWREDRRAIHDLAVGSIVVEAHQ